MRAMHPHQAHVRIAVFATIFSFARAANFTFSYGKPTQCDNFPVSWTGGSPPFQLQLIPEFGTERNFTIPDENYKDGKGSYEAQLPFASGKGFLAVLSDSTGYASGGVTKILKVGDSMGGQSCNTTDPGAAFFFELNMPLDQCRSYSFSSYTGAVQPVTITGAIPGGQTFTLYPPKNSTYFIWKANIAAGTQVLFRMADARGNTGGCSDVKLVGASDDSSCLDSSSPSSVSVIPSSTASPDSGSTTTDKGSNTGVIIGGTLAAFFGIATIVALALFFIRKRQQRRGYYGGGPYKYGGDGRIQSVDLDAPVVMHDANQPVVQPFPLTLATTAHLNSGNGSLSQNMSPSSHDLLPGQAGSQYSRSRYDSQTRYTVTNGVPSESGYSQSTQGPPKAHRLSTADSGAYGAGPSSPTSSAARRKAAMAGIPSYNPATRYIVHTDYAEAQPPPAEEDIVELPPQYSESRAPIPGLHDYTRPPNEPVPGPSSNPLEAEGSPHDRQLQQPLAPSQPNSPRSEHPPS